MQVVILCGGKGTRLGGDAMEIPKALMPIGGHSILWHIMKTYSHFGHREFVLCLGYRSNQIKEYFRDYAWRYHSCRLVIDKGKDSDFEVLKPADERWEILFVDTGENTHTGGRIKRVQPFIRDDTFFATYGDGVSNIDLNLLQSFHKNHGKVATVTAVRPNVNFGLMHLDHHQRVTGFREKPKLDEFVNGGFFVFNRQVFDYLEPNCILERQPLEKLASDQQLMAFRHDGFWMCMDTYKDNVELNDIWARGDAPWKVWNDT